MRAFIEYPDVSDDRIEIKSEFFVETKRHKTERIISEELDGHYWKDNC